MEFPVRFIQATREYSTPEAPIPAPYLRKLFNISKELSRADIIITGLGFYELFVNGRRITKGRLAPYRSNPCDIVYFDSYDITTALKDGDNLLGITLGNGFQNSFGGDVWDFDKAKSRSAPKTAFLLTLNYSDGTSERLEADESVLTHPSPVILDDLHIGEFYDARLEIPGWNTDTKLDTSDWKNALISESPTGEYRLCTAEPITEAENLTPVSITHGCIGRMPRRWQSHYVVPPLEDERARDGWLYDFGINSAGIIKLRVNGKKGQKIILQYGEELYNGGIDLSAMNFLPERYVHRDIYICKGEPDEEYTPTFTYHGFRYVLVIGLDDSQATPELLTYITMHSDIKSVGEFSCSDGMSNRIVKAALVSDLSNLFYFPTDCPHREKLGWTGDAALSAEHMLTYLSVGNSLSVWLDNIRKAQLEDGSLPGIVPTSGWGYAWGNGPVFDRVITELPYQIYRFTGNKAVLSDNAQAIFRYLSYLTTKIRDDGLLCFGLGDWCETNYTRCEDSRSPLEFTATVISVDICNKAAKIFDILGMTLQKAFAQSLADRLTSASRKRLIDTTTFTAKGNCQTSQAMAIYYGIFTEDERPGALERLKEIIDADDGLCFMGILGFRTLFRVLADNGMADLAFNMITTKRFPSYGNWISCGATSLWEDFQPEDKKLASHNHHFFGDVSAWYMRYAAGIEINPLLISPDNVNLSPVFLSGLDSAEASYTSPSGTVRVSWKRDGGAVIYTATIPEGVTGVIRAPDGMTTDDGKTLLTAVSGTYRFVGI